MFVWIVVDAYTDRFYGAYGTEALAIQSLSLTFSSSGGIERSGDLWKGVCLGGVEVFKIKEVEIFDRAEHL